MALATMTSKGQVTVPKSVRALLHLEAGDVVDFRVRPDGVVEMVPAREDLLSLYGILKPAIRGVTVEDMNETIREQGGRS
jgi:AbrB family looped-hinge helix DNA binding protein